jgi:hypothetical protein
MGVNFVRGFRRIGWVITFPVAVLIVLVFSENAQEFSPLNYEVTQTTPTPWPADFMDGALPPGVVELPGMGRAFFLEEVPKDVVDRILNDFKAKYKPPVVSGGLVAQVLSKERAAHQTWAFKVHKQVSKLRLAGLILGSVLISALIIQGGISVLAWVVRGFKG